MYVQQLWYSHPWRSGVNVCTTAVTLPSLEVHSCGTPILEVQVNVCTTAVVLPSLEVRSNVCMTAVVLPSLEVQSNVCMTAVVLPSLEVQCKCMYDSCGTPIPGGLE